MNQNKTKINREILSSPKNKFVTLLGFVYEQEEGGERTPCGHYFKMIEVRKIRLNLEKDKGILDLGEELVIYGTEESLTPENFPPDTSEFRIQTVRLEQDKETQAEALMKEWINHLIVDKDYQFLGVVKDRTTTKESSPSTLRFDLEKEE